MRGPHVLGRIGLGDVGGALLLGNREHQRHRCARVSWDEAGVGQTTVSYTLAANGTATYACLNGGGNHPKAANKATVNGPVSASGTFPVIKNGRVTGSLSAGPPGPGSFSCPGGQTLVLASVTYTDIVLTDTTNGVTADLGSVSRTFFAV